MAKCKKCGRILEDGEGATCPACKSKRAHRWRTVTKVAGVVVAITMTVVTRGRWRGKI